MKLPFLAHVWVLFSVIVAKLFVRLILNFSSMNRLCAFQMHFQISFLRVVTLPLNLQWRSIIYEVRSTIEIYCSCHQRSTLRANPIIEFGPAEETLEAILQNDPFRLDNMDAYSNILYVKEDKARLSYLANLAHNTDKYRPETCCIIGSDCAHPPE